MAIHSPAGRAIAPFDLARQAAEQACSAQDYPSAALYMVATPIGNLADISLRALHVLQLADVLACEDTRHSLAMLRMLGIDKAKAQVLAAHQHNESQIAQTVVQLLAQGKRVAYISDAGTPAISDPGARLAASAHAHGHRVIPIPGASSITAVLSAAGLVHADSDANGIVFVGFLPSKPGERQAAVGALAAEKRAVVLLEAPHRIEALAMSLAALGARNVTIGRELTKQFEQIVTMPASEFTPWLAGDPYRLRGEFALVLHPKMPVADAEGDLRVLELLLPELPLKTAVRLAADITGQARNALYEKALMIKKGATQDHP